MEKPNGNISQNKMIEVVDDLHLTPATRAEMLIEGVHDLDGLPPAVKEETIIEVIAHLETGPEFAELPSFVRTQAIIVALNSLDLPSEAKTRAKLLLTMEALGER
ncbi:MAG: hypothetical protein GY796_23270 [Chloroflexi bacterium]|nr:hypothetical protein [Chloroflexota bacterium]